VEGVDWIHLTQNRVQWRAVVNTEMSRDTVVWS